MKASAIAVNNRRMAELAGGVAAAALLAASAMPAKAGGLSPAPENQYWLSIEGSQQWWNHDNNLWAQRFSSTDGNGVPIVDHEIDFDNGDFSSFAGTLEIGVRPAGSAWDYAALVEIGQLTAGDSVPGSLDDNGDHDLVFAWGQCDSSNPNCDVHDEMDFVNLDLVTGYNSAVTSGINARGIAGARIGFYDFTRSFDSIVLSSENSNHLKDIEESATFIGAGPLIGGTVDAQIGRNPNFRFVGKAQTGVMWGSLDYNAHQQDLNGDGPIQEFGFEEDDTETVFFADLAAGLAAVVAEGVTIDFGWKASYVSDVVKTTTNMCTKDSGDRPNCAPTDPIHEESTGDVWHHGPYARITGAF